MIELTRINGTKLVLNSYHFERIESLPNTTITMMNNQKYIVTEPKDEILELIKEYYRAIYLENKNTD